MAFSDDDRWIWDLEDRITQPCNIEDSSCVCIPIPEEFLEDYKDSSLLVDESKRNLGDTKPIPLSISWIVALRKEGISSCYTV